MDVSALGSDKVGKSGVGGSKRLPDGEGGRSGDAIGKADRGMLAMLAASADPPSLDRHLGRDGYQSHSGVTEQREVGFDGVGIAAEDSDHLVADFRGVDRRQPGGPAEQSGNFCRGWFCAKVGDDGVGVQDGHEDRAVRR
jgi:hypothetical protein